jgi:hypothetical protein
MSVKIAILAAILCAPLAAAPATQPSASALELRATTAFNNGQYALALPLLQKLQGELSNQPQRLGMIAEEIRVCQTQIAKAVASDPTAAAAAAAGPAMTAEMRKPHLPPQPDELRGLEIKELGNFEYDADKGGNIPADVKALSGMKLRLHGFMIPMDQADNITHFALVPSLFACCFGQPPQIQHTIVCKAPAGKAVSYYPDELLIEGKLKVEEKKDEGFIVSVFEVDVSSVKPATK